MVALGAGIFVLPSLIAGAFGANVLPIRDGSWWGTLGMLTLMGTSALWSQVLFAVLGDDPRLTASQRESIARGDSLDDEEGEALKGRAQRRWYRRLTESEWRWFGFAMGLFVLGLAGLVVDGAS